MASKVTLTALLLASAQLGAAATIYTNFGPGNSYDTASSASIFYSSFLGSGEYHFFGLSFTPSATYQLGTLRLPVSMPLKPFLVSVTGTTNFGGTFEPGATVESFKPTGTGSTEMLTLTSVTNPILTAGTQYWVVVAPDFATWIVGNPIGSPGDSGAWFNNNQGITGITATRESFEKLPTPDSVAIRTAPALEVLSFSPQSAQVPEPATLSVAIGSLLFFAFRRARVNTGITKSKSEVDN